MPVNGVLMSPLVARLRKTVSAARNPPGEMLMPLYFMVVGPVSSAFWAAACSVATVVLRASLLAFKSLIVGLSGMEVDVTSAGVFTASLALVPACAGRAVSGGAAWRSCDLVGHC